MSESMNNFFIEKVEEIRRNFPDQKMSPMEILRKLIPEPTSTFELKEISIKRTKEYLDNLKPTNTVGFDRITSRVFKMSSPLFLS